MTIEEKVRSIVRTAIDNFLVGNKEASDQAARAILALMRPMSRERLIEVMEGVMRTTTYELFIPRLADAILAEWGKD